MQKDADAFQPDINSRFIVVRARLKCASPVSCSTLLRPLRHTGIPLRITQQCCAPYHGPTGTPEPLVHRQSTSLPGLHLHHAALSCSSMCPASTLEQGISMQASFPSASDICPSGGGRLRRSAMRACQCPTQAARLCPIILLLYLHLQCPSQPHQQCFKTF